MKITCEHCGCAIDIENDKKCPNCKAPYKDNKEYKRYKEKMSDYDMREREASIRSKEIANDIIKGTTKSFSVGFIVFALIFISIFGIIIFQIISANRNFDKINNYEINTNKDKDKEEEKEEEVTISLRETASMKKYDLKFDEIREYNYDWYEKGKYRTTNTKYYAFHFVIKNKTSENLKVGNFIVSYTDKNGNEGILANKLQFPNDMEKPLALKSHIEANYSTSGYIFYEVPSYVKKVQIVYDHTVKMEAILR